MEFGVFYQLPCAEGQTPAARYDDTIAQARLADELGFDAVWLAELHFNPRFSVMSSPLLVASAIAQVTRRIKLGTAVNLVPLHHPIRLAEETASLDLLSHGRAIFGIGRGSNPSHFTGYGIDINEGREGFQEAVDIILKAWTNDELDYEGKHYRIKNVHVVPKPYQKPHPPVYVAANSEDTFGLVGCMGHNILVAPMISTTQGARAGLEVYRREMAGNGRQPGRGRINLNVPTFVAESAKRARAGFEPSINNYLNTLRATSLGRGAERAMRLSYDQISEEFAAIGEPEECVDKLHRLRETFRPQEFMCWFNTGGMLPHQEVARSMRLFAEKVMPHFP